MDDDPQDTSTWTWRRLALQFDAHRMQALAHLRCMVDAPEQHRGAVQAFLAAPPPDGGQELARRIKALAEHDHTQLLKEARKIIRASSSRSLANDWDRRATAALKESR